MMRRLTCSRILVFVALLALATPASTQRAVILVRHDDKETDTAKLRDLKEQDVPLSEAGEKRASLHIHFGRDKIPIGSVQVTSISAFPAELPR